MFTVSHFEEKFLDNPHFVKPLRLNYILNDIKKTWEAVQSHDSVSVLIYNRDRDAFVLVKQFRAPVYRNDHTLTYTYELCAGIIDKDKPLKQIVQEEIDEECGYRVSCESIEKITSFYTNVGVSGSKQHLYFVSVTDEMKIHDGGGVESEDIVVEYLHVNDANRFMYDETLAKTPGLLFAFEWFFKNHLKI
jgi:UDP-sugar diphosphatase